MAFLYNKFYLHRRVHDGGVCEYTVIGTGTAFNLLKDPTSQFGVTYLCRAEIIYYSRTMNFDHRLVHLYSRSDKDSTPEGFTKRCPSNLVFFVQLSSLGYG